MKAQLFLVKTEELVLNEPHEIPEENIATICEMMARDKTYFEKHPIICSRRTGKTVIISGEDTFVAANRIGIDEIPIAIIPGSTRQVERMIQRMGRNSIRLQP